MRDSENARHFVHLLREIEPKQRFWLCLYAGSNVFYRVSRRQLFRGATFCFTFGRFHVLPSRGDLGTIGEIFVKKPYQSYAEFIPQDGDTCIDIGANIGCVSLQWRLTDPTGIIIAVEPHPVTYERMCTNFKLNAVRDVDAVRAAVGSANGSVEIVIDKYENSMARVMGDHLRFIKAYRDQEIMTVPCVTIDTLVRDRHIDRVDILKIDVEGFEVECLRGAEKTLAHTSRVVIEVHSDELKQSCETILAASGFALQHSDSLLFASRS